MKSSAKGRQYVHKTAPSVTEIIGLLDDGLKEWYGWLGTAECKRITKEAADFGREVHERIAQYILRRPLAPVLDEDMDWVVKEFIKFLTPLTTAPLLVEPSEGLYSVKYNFNGTPDFVNNGVVGVVGYDWKTGKLPRGQTKQQLAERRRQKTFKYGLQCAAYTLLIEENYKLKVKEFHIIQINKQREKAAYKFSAKLLKKFQRHFLALRNLYFEYKGI